MKRLLLLIALALTSLSGFAASTPSDSVDSYQLYADSVHATLHYQTGRITLPEGKGILTVPAGFRYLDVAQSRYVMTKLWDNPDGESLGMLFPATKGPLDGETWAFSIEFDPLGYVQDDDAADINYDDLLKEMQEDTEAANDQREQDGFGRVLLVGWASKPFYDPKLNVLHWAKELRFSGTSAPTLNYNVRLLGRKGVLNLNAIGGLEQLPEVRASIPAVIQSIAFAKGEQYTDFDPKLDEVAAYGIGGLVAGKVLAKVGAFALVAKFWKVIIALLAAAGTTVRRFFGRKTASDE